MTIPIYQIDAFTSEPFKGNPAAVCLLSAARDEPWMQGVAAEMNLSETAFLYPLEDGFHLRWFTPECEVDLCGHATLASAHALWESGVLPAETPARFQTKSGLLTAAKKGDWIELDLPADEGRPMEIPDKLSEALGIRPLLCRQYGIGYLAELDSRAAVTGLKPDFAGLKRLPVGLIIVTSRGEKPDIDFVSRLFAPRLGIDEDPVTGAAHCCLGPYWSAKLNKNPLVGYQASARGGLVRVGVQGDRAILSGQAVTVLRGELLASV